MATTHIPVHVTLEVDEFIEHLNVMANAMLKIGTVMVNAADELIDAQERRVAEAEAEEASANRDSGAATVAACDDADEPGHEASR